MRFGKSPRQGLTLIEVTVGIALASTLLAGIMLASGRNARQARAAQLRLEAVDAAEELLQSWFAEEASAPRGATGTFADHDRFRWRTEVRQRQQIGQQVVEVVRLDVLMMQDNQEKIVTQVEFLAAVSGENRSGRENGQ